MNGLSTLLERASARRHALSRDELVALLGLADPGEIAALHAAAYAVKVRHSGRLVSLRGIIEMGNVCAKDCYYCGIRKGNDCVGRFELDEEAVLRAVRRNIDLRYGSLVLQSGEIASEKHTAFIERILRKIDELGGGAIGVTLSLGEQSEETYVRWRAAGAHRYLLRIETSSPELYAKLHPADHSFERRVDCLRLLRKCGYQVGSGVMSGLPRQTLDDLADLATDELIAKKRQDNRRGPARERPEDKGGVLGEYGLSEEQAAYLQSLVDSSGEAFRARVLKYRTDISPDDMRGQGFTGDEAAARGFTAGTAKDLSAAIAKFRRMI